LQNYKKLLEMENEKYKFSSFLTKKHIIIRKNARALAYMKKILYLCSR